MEKSKKVIRLNRFTTLPVLLDLLERKKLVLLDPETWEDKNDVEVIKEYKKKAGIRKLFALCFTHENETIHHWKTYSHGSSGCCIEFNAAKIFDILSSHKNIRHNAVIYKKLQDVEYNPIPIVNMPFVKRWPYRCEQEYRIIWEGKTTANNYEIDIPLNTINKITISQNMPDQIFKTIKNYLSFYKNPEARISRSTIYENRSWIACFKAVESRKSVC